MDEVEQKVNSFKQYSDEVKTNFMFNVFINRSLIAILIFVLYFEKETMALMLDFINKNIIHSQNFILQNLSFKLI